MDYASLFTGMAIGSGTGIIVGTLYGARHVLGSWNQMRRSRDRLLERNRKLAQRNAALESENQAWAHMQAVRRAKARVAGAKGRASQAFKRAADRAERIARIDARHAAKEMV